MNIAMSESLLRIAVVAAAAVVLAACASRGPAPVIDRPRAPAPEPAAAARPGMEFHVVRRGETLYSIARTYGRDPKDLAAWNNLESPGLISVGQQLRVAPPEPAAASAGTVVNPILPPGQVEVRPIAGAATTPGAATPPSADNLVREPKGGKQPYSEQALAMLQKRDEPAATPPPAVTRSEPKVETKPDAKPEARPEAKPEAKPESKPDARAGEGESGIDWAWPASGKLVGEFNDPANKGVDIGGRAGDPVLAAASGKVMYVGSGIRGYGNLVIVKHTNGYLSAYAHNRKILVKENQQVTKGQKIAELGDSDSDQAKLHFEIRRQGKPVDPLKYLPPR
jgi:lipoprotein NlpD